MPFPAARVGDLTVTGDAITGPGVATMLIYNIPTAVIDDLISETTVINAITMDSPTMLIGGRPAARLTSLVSGAHAITGIPLTTTVGPPGAPTVLIA